ncbi:MAG: hypothetical protein Q8J70_09135 [Thiobacillus sp.]|nr:hypothetical protein [Thiobacillus sp.]
MRLLSLTLLALWGTTLSAAEPDVDPDTGLRSWQTDQAGVQVRLTQINSDQARAFYLARGFSAAATERYVAECVFMTVVRNIGDVPIQHRLSDWRYTAPGKPPQRIRSKTEWERLWKKLGVKESARIAFTWAQFPTTQTFETGDWNQGMTTYNVPRDTSFSLTFVWRTGGTIHTGQLENVRCSS